MYEVSDFDLMKAPINTKVAIHKDVKNLYRNMPVPYSVKDIAMLKLSLYIREYNEGDHPADYQKLKSGIDNLHRVWKGNASHKADETNKNETVLVLMTTQSGRSHNLLKNKNLE